MQKQIFTALLLVTTLFVTAQRPTMEPPNAAAPKAAEKDQYPAFKREINFFIKVHTLFDFPFVQKVFIAANFITITKTDNVPWDFINMELREFIKNFISEGKDVLVQMPTPAQLLR